MNEDRSIGCFFIAAFVLSAAWIIFLIWAISSIVNWLVTK